MKDSLLRAPKTGIAARGNKSKLPRPDSKPHPNSDDLDASFSASPPSQVSTIIDPSISPGGDFEEISSSSPARTLLFENSSDPSDLLVVTDAEIPLSITSKPFVVLAGGGEDSDEIWMESSGPRTAEVERDVKLEKAMVGFSNTVEKLGDSITEMLLRSMELRKLDEFSPRRLAEMALACFVSAVMVLLITTAASPSSGLIWIKPSEFNGPAPT